MQEVDFRNLTEGLFRGERLHLSKAITLAETESSALFPYRDRLLQLAEEAPKPDTFRLAVTGVPGAGKSTLLKLLSKVTGPTKGNIKVKGRIASLLEVGTGFHPELSGRENIFLNGAILGMTKREIASKLDEIISFSGVDKYIDTPVKRYSSGMYVRLAFAVAAHLEPEILIIDEVLAVGDAEFQKKCLGKMKDVAQQGRTVLFVSHNIVAVQQLCTKGLFLKNGCLEYHGDIEKTLPHYFDFENVSAKKDVYDLSEKVRSNGVAKVIKKAWLENLDNELIASTAMGDGFKICFDRNTFDSLCLI
jgi:lipopolysaccharide transport system ATP-binding protein